MATIGKTSNQRQTSSPPGQEPGERQPHRASNLREREDQRPVPDERQQREERILDAAAALLVRWGFRKTTIDDVAREAGVGKGTIYLHWRDKNELFRAALLRAQQRAGVEVMQRIAADPEGGRFHRLWTHGMMAALADPLMAAIMKGQSDIFQGLAGAFDAGTIHQLVGDYEAYIVQLQQAGLMRADVPVSVISFVTSALKIGVINTHDLLSQEQRPSMEQLTDAISDLLRRWLEPEQLPSDTTVGKQLVTEWWEKVKEVENQQQ
ncbi:MAG TPA: TetR/AcrR family transcriptional regulator [Ktedonobacterales bacterium]|nr:TetR/AcrR family transcriptional regulator [Ktedonobacterales bacterium]